tara:strand:- start:240 stop:674 length:435 start_codon:yes stop_codon:yes gene_type:complete
MDKYLYFRTVADVDNDDGDAGSAGAVDAKTSACYPVSSLLGMQAATSTSLKFYFRGLQNTHGDGSAANADNKSDVVLVNVTAGRIREVMAAVIDKINEPVSRDNGLIVVADDVTTNLNNETVSAEYISSHITSCSAIVIQDAQV